MGKVNVPTCRAMGKAMKQRNNRPSSSVFRLTDISGLAVIKSTSFLGSNLYSRASCLCRISIILSMMLFQDVGLRGALFGDLFPFSNMSLIFRTIYLSFKWTATIEFRGKYSWKETRKWGWFRTINGFVINFDFGWLHISRWGMNHHWIDLISDEGRIQRVEQNNPLLEHQAFFGRIEYEANNRHTCSNELLHFLCFVHALIEPRRTKH